jgi:hypothetical protein
MKTAKAQRFWLIIKRKYPLANLMITSNLMHKNSMSLKRYTA